MNRNKLYIFFIGVSLFGYAWLGWNIAEDSYTPTVCMFKAVTHLPCPSCGTTRALVLLANGDVKGSLLVNPFGVFLALGLVIVPLWVLLDAFWKKDSFFRLYVSCERSFVTNKLLSASMVVLVVINWFWNIVKGL